MKLYRPVANNYAGQPRRVGVEMEFQNVPLMQVAELVQARFGGAVQPRGEEIIIVGTRLGDFRVEVDSRWVKKVKAIQRGAPAADAPAENLLPAAPRAENLLPAAPRAENLLPAAPRAENLLNELADTCRRTATQVAAEVAQEFVPIEIITPPVPEAQLPQLDMLREDLRRAGAAGTFHSPLFAFALHLNPEPRSLEPGYLKNVMLSFFLLTDWLWEEIRPDVTRQLIGFFKSYPPDYGRLLADPGYAPDLPRLMDDYLDHVPDRNYALDMYPLFLWLDRARLERRGVPDKIGARPTYHYRLPNCCVDDPRWRLRREWRRWRQVERLAERPRLLRQLAARHQAHAASLWQKLTHTWAGEVKDVLQQHGQRLA